MTPSLEKRLSRRSTRGTTPKKACFDSISRNGRRTGDLIFPSGFPAMASTRRLAAIMFTDTVGYTASTQTDEARALELLRQQAEIVRPLISAHHGREIKSTGDGFLVEFDSALKATHCAIDIQRRIYERNAEGTLAPIQIRIGIHLGDVVQSETDILGDAVNIAARIQPMAEPGGICLSGAVREQVWNKITDPLEKLPSKALKGVQFPTEIYRVVLPWTGRAPLPGRSGPPRLAVLPFVNISPDPNDEYFSDGLTEEMIARLSLLKGLEVIARTSAMTYKNTSKSAGQIGRELGAGTLLEGSVRKAGNRIRVTVQLINSATEGHLWVENFDRSLEDIFAVQSEVAAKVASSLRVKLLEEDRRRIETGGTTNLEAYTLLLKGRFHLHRWDRASLSHALGYFQAAVDLDPKYAAAYAGQASVYAAMGVLDLADPKEVYPKAEEYARKALELDESLPEAHAARAMSMWNTYDFFSIRAELDRAIELDPNSVNAHRLQASRLAMVGEWGECVKEGEKALELDPLSVQAAGDLGTWYLYAGQYDQAIQHLKDAVELDSKNAFYLDNLGLAHVLTGDLTKGLEELESAAEASGTPDSLSDLAYAYVKAGKPEGAERLLTKLLHGGEPGRLHSLTIGSIYASLGETEKSMDWLERAYAERSGNLAGIQYDLPFEGMRENSRFRSLLKKMNLA